MLNELAPKTSDVQINVLYFISLALALSASSVCILGKQWIREYQKDLSVSACDAVRVRQARYDSLEAWKVPQIMAALPVILLAALLLFFSGLLVQLWNASDRTTAAAVTVVITITVLMVIITTVVPAYCSMQPNRKAFTPFRSPQSWLWFVIYRRLHRWASILLGVHQESPSMPSGWSAFDLQFLRMESAGWFDHDISSVHRALRWVFDVPRKSIMMEKAVYWCLQSQFHPQDLVESEAQLRRHVLSDSEDAEFTNDLNLVYYRYSRRAEGRHDISTPVGRYQTELHIRSVHEEIDKMLMSDRQGAWAHITDSCDILWTCGIRDDYSYKEHLSGMFPLLCNSNTVFLTRLSEDQHIFQDQASLLLERIFDIPLPSDPFYRRNIVYLLLKARQHFSSPFSQRVTGDLVNVRIPSLIRTHNSVSLLYDIGEATYFGASVSWEHAIKLYTLLDKIMVDMCNRPEGIQDMNEESVRRWKRLRVEFIEKIRLWPVQERLQLTHGYFDDLPDHGPSSPTLPFIPLTSR